MNQLYIIGRELVVCCETNHEVCQDGERFLKLVIEAYAWHLGTAVVVGV